MIFYFNLAIETDSYYSTLYKVDSLLKTVTELTYENPNPDKQALLWQIGTIVEMCIQMLPLSEMHYLDKILINKSENQPCVLTDLRHTS